MKDEAYVSITFMLCYKISIPTGDKTRSGDAGNILDLVYTLSRTRLHFSIIIVRLNPYYPLLFAKLN